MHTASSASRTCISSASAVEWTSTVLIPISCAARWTRDAISPRLDQYLVEHATAHLFDDDEPLIELAWLRIFDRKLRNPAGPGRGGRGQGRTSKSTNVRHSINARLKAAA